MIEGEVLLDEVLLYFPPSTSEENEGILNNINIEPVKPKKINIKILNKIDNNKKINIKPKTLIFNRKVYVKNFKR